MPDQRQNTFYGEFFTHIPVFVIPTTKKTQCAGKKAGRSAGYGGTTFSFVLEIYILWTILKKRK
jgi:hypothetical protein